MAGSGTAALRSAGDVVLRVEHLRVEFPAHGGGTVHAVSDVSFDVADRETLGIVGESGCGKSSTGRAIMQLPPPTAGSVVLEGIELTSLKGDALRRVRPHLQMVFQDPVASLNPRWSVREIIAEGLRIWGERDGDAAGAIDVILDAVGLDPELADRRPAELSGGQCQRVGIARSLVLRPRVVVCDEPVSALDVSVQAQIVNLLDEMQERYGLTLVLIAHDLAVVRHVADRVMVMYLGKVCELGGTDEVYQRPAHPYTRLLLASVPGAADAGVSDEDAAGELPSPLDPPSGCRFRTRCPLADDVCTRLEPELRSVGPDHFVACHHVAAGAGVGDG